MLTLAKSLLSINQMKEEIKELQAWIVLQTHLSAVWQSLV